MKNLIITLCCFFLLNYSFTQESFTLLSPDKKISVKISTDKDIRIAISHLENPLLDPSPVSMKLKNAVLGMNGKVVKKTENTVNRKLIPEISIKEKEVIENYNELSLRFKDNYSLTIRAYNEGIGYRFETTMKDSIEVIEENAEYNFSENYTCWWPKEYSFHSNNQVYYDNKSLMELDSTDLGSLPLILKPLKGPSIVLTETDLTDYPGLWIKGSKDATIKTTNPRYPKRTEQKNDRNVFVKTRENFIAKTNGTRTFPWRVFAIAENDADLITNQLTYLMAGECKIDDYSWIKPGRIAWDWWNANNISGVDFEAGINNETYKYYIDFAAKYGIEYILLDEGWYVLGDLLEQVPEIDVEELVRYGKERGVDIILWVVWKTLDDQLDQALDTFVKWGVKGIKIDFMDKDDQWMVNYYHRIAQKCADHKLLINFHGSYKSAGLRRMYPNVLTREGVNGGEQYKWSYRQTPEHNLITPFGRMLAGPMDYTPGAMNNAQENNFKAIFDRPMSMGTRCHQLAMYVCYESPLQMLCDAPSNYYKEPEAMEFLEKVPVVWDETIVLHAKVADYLVVARKREDNWYLGGMSDWSERQKVVDFSFLDENKKYKLILLKDGINANRIATDFKRVEKVITNNDSLTIIMAKGGGFAAQIIPMD